MCRRVRAEEGSMRQRKEEREGGESGLLPPEKDGPRDGGGQAV